MKIILALALTACLTGSAPAQTNRIPFARALGEATVSVQPDQAQIAVSVVTQAQTAQAASSQNAAAVTAVIGQLNALLGPSADIKTISYSLTPVYSYSGQQATLTGYSASNTIQVTTGDLSTTGKIIDTAIQAGANQISSLQFGLKDDTAARTQALKLATAQAKTKADAMASGLGMKLGMVQVIQEGYAVRGTTQQLTGAAAAAATPVQSGTVSVQANVTLDISLQ